MARKANDRFQKFIERQEEKNNFLPLTHTTTAYSFADMCDDDEIEPRKCKYFNKKIIYLFYGRPAYRTEKSEFTDLQFNWPITFIFDPEKINGITDVYPFDTGAFHINLYNRFFSKMSDISDFRLPGSLDYAARTVSSFYASDKEYLYGRSQKNLEVNDFDFEVQGMQKLSQEPSFTSRLSDDQITRDERSSAIEVQVSDPINIKSSTLDLIIPQRYLQIPKVVEAMDRWGISKENVHYYETMGFFEQGGWLPQIYSLVERIYKKRGFIEDDM